MELVLETERTPAMMSSTTSENPSLLSRIGMVIGLVLLSMWFASKIKGGYEAYQLLNVDSTIDAVCTHSTYGREGGTHYTFTVKDQIYHGEAPKKHLDQGGTLKVVFLESNPSINRPVDRVTFDVWAGGLMASFLILSVIFLCFFRLRRRPARDEKALLPQSRSAA